MSTTLLIPSAEDRPTRYEALLPQVAHLIDDGSDAIAAMANICAALHGTFGWHWVGFYRVVGDHLVLGPFQGPVACTRIAHGKGVCGTAWATGTIQLVPDVDLFPGHIACSSLSRSELVIPVTDASGRIAAVLDIDSVELNGFDERDAAYLTQVLEHLRPLL
jgi:L-methionine (R)-S-oxide reductase